MTDEERAMLKQFAPMNGRGDLIDVDYAGRVLLSLVAFALPFCHLALSH